MNKYKVTLFLMVDPTKGDETTPHTYESEAVNECAALKSAEESLDADELIRHRSVFDYKIEKLCNKTQSI